MELFKKLEETFAPEVLISQAEKHTNTVLAYVQPKELSKTLVDLNTETSKYARAQIQAFKSIGELVQGQVEELTKSFTKSVK